MRLYYHDRAGQPLTQELACPISTTLLQFDLHHVNRGQKKASSPKRHIMSGCTICTFCGQILGQEMVYKPIHLTTKQGWKTRPMSHPSTKLTLLQEPVPQLPTSKVRAWHYRSFHFSSSATLGVGISQQLLLTSEMPPQTANC